MQNNKPLQADIVWLLSATKNWVAKIGQYFHIAVEKQHLQMR